MLKLFDTKIHEKDSKLVTKYDKKVPEILLGDAIRLLQIILNSVSNAVKFTLEGKITVAVHLLFEDQEKVLLEFEITAKGIGIPEDNINLIFENFQEASNGSYSLYGGNGLGFSIVKQLVTLQGENVRVKSTKYEGSTFRFTLPFRKTKNATKVEDQLEIIVIETIEIKVLVVKDIALNHLLMKTIFNDFGFESDIVDNEQVAIEKLRSHGYDVILLDLQIPFMNGFEATEYIHNTMNLQTAIIALTANITTVDLGKCKEMRMNDCFAKPIDEKLLYDKIVELTNKENL